MGRKNEALWKRIVASVKGGDKGGKPGQWSARKAQLATQRYKKAGGEYTGSKTKAQKSLSKWTKEDWGTKSGKPSTQGSKATGERYLPKKVREGLTKKEYEATTRKKRQDTAKGKQFSKQPKKVAEKTSKLRGPSMSGHIGGEKAAGYKIYKNEGDMYSKPKGTNMKGVPHYKKDGTEYRGATHKSGKQLMSGKEHTGSSVNLFHKDEIPGPNLVGNQSRIDMNKDGKITKKDFDMLNKGPNMRGSWIRKHIKG
jgi:hypothetical protein